MKAEPIAPDKTTGCGVLVLGASAGGQAAILAVLRDLPLDFDVPIVVVQHLAPESTVVGVYSARLGYSFEWIDEHSCLASRKVLLCPPRACVELLPDGSFRLEPCAGAADKQVDRLLVSVARSFGHRAIAVILTGMGSDGAAGAAQLHRAGGCVLVQSESSAEFADMPRAALAAGAADLVVPLGDIAQVLNDIVSGAVEPRPRSELEAIERVFGLEGEIAALARKINWLHTPLGPALQWPAELCLLARTAMEQPHPAALWWGRELVLIYNEAYGRFLGESTHSRALGAPARRAWAEVWSDLGPLAERVMKGGAAVQKERFLLLLDRHGFVEEVFSNFAFSPIRDARGNVVAMHHAAWDVTEQVVAARRMVALRTLAEQIAGAQSPRSVCDKGAAALTAAPLDLPFVLLYLFDPKRRQASLAGAAGLVAGSSGAPHTMTMAGAGDTWALQRLVESVAIADSAGVLLEDLGRRVPDMASHLAAQPTRPLPHSAVVLPLRWGEDTLPIGALVAGLSPQRPFDEDYRSFVGLVARQVSGGLAEARARELEREQRERLAGLDRAKTEFFANVSHDFRTPLTLLLSPLEEMLRRRNEFSAELAAEIDVAARNSRRLLRLVDDLLDFSQVEQRRQRVALRPTDLGRLTTDVASAFRSAVERAGLRLSVQCPDDLPLVPVDGEMWERIVSNLLSNALKFTFEGEITVRLRALALHAELVVSDTGIGIPKQELPNLFKRFHRVRGARARTIEGSGIGLALAHDLVTRMGGQVQVHSREGRGTTFTVWMPLQSSRATFDEAATTGADAPRARIAAGLAEEADTWLADRVTAGIDEVLDAPKGEHLRLAAGAHVLVADDNADLRDYLKRLLGAYWRVTAVADGEQALHAARSQRPDLILADVMMPALDGFALLRAVRHDELLKHTPLIFLTARAGEDTAIEGLLAGADDYLAKPFSARELIARVGGQIELSRARRRTEELNAFLVRFSDAVRGLRDPTAVAETACRLVAEDLRVDRAHWSEVDWTTREFAIGVSCERAGVPAIRGRFALDAWEPFTTLLLDGKPVVLDDTQSDPRVPPPVREGYARLAVGAQVAMPVLADGRLVGLLSVHQREARHWTAEELAVAASVAGRCWPEIERARAEAALRESEAHLATELKDARALQKISNELVSQGSRNGHYGHIVDMARTLMRSDAASIQELDAADASLKLLAHTGFHAESAAFWATVDAGVGSSCGRALVVRERVVVPDMDAFDADPDDVAAYRKSGILSVQSTPLVSSTGRIVGMLSTHWSHPHTPSAESYRYFDILSRLAADFMERALAEAALRDSEAKSRAMFETMIEACCIFDMIYDDQGKPVDWRILEANPAYERQSGLKGVAGKLASEVMPGTETYWHEAFGRVAATGEPEVIEKWHQPTDRWVHSSTARVGGAGSRRLVSVFYDITERKRAEIALRESAERQAFLLKLSDTLRPLADANEIIRSACRVLGEHTQADRALYADVADEKTVMIGPNHVNGVPPIELVLNAEDFGQGLVAAYRRGETVIFSDADTAPAFTEQDRRNLASIGVVANISVPLLKAGRWVGVMGLHHGTPRSWSPFEIELVEATAERVWAAIERARAERALRESDERLRTLFESIDEGYVISEVVFDERGDPVDLYFVQANPAAIRLAGRDFTGQRLRAIDPDCERDWIDMHAHVVRTGEPAHGERYAAPHGRWLEFRASRIGGPGIRRVAVVYQDVTERRQRAERQEVLLRLSDALRPLADAAEIEMTACRVLGEHLGAQRTYYVEIDEAAAVARVERQYLREGATSSVGTHALADFGWSLAPLRRGEAIVVDDIRRSPLVSAADVAAMEAVQQAAIVAVPLVKGGALVGVLCASEAVPRPWRPDEVDLARETLERMWAAAQRARAEQALSEELRNTRILQDLGARLIAEGDYQTIYEQVMSAAIDITHAQAGTVQMLDDGSKELVLLATRGFSAKTKAYFHRVDASSNTSCGLALRSGERTFLDFDPASTDMSMRLHVDEGLLSAQSSPLVSRSGRAIGMVSTHWAERGRRPSERELRFLDLLARQAADLIEQRRAERLT